MIHNFGACLYERISVLLNFSIIFFKRQDSKWPKLEEKAAIGRFQAIEELKNKQARVWRVLYFYVFFYFAILHEFYMHDLTV